MTRYTMAAAVGVASLGCGGLLVDRAGLAEVEGAMRAVSPEVAVPIYLAGVSESRAPNPLCADLVGHLANASPDARAPMAATLLFHERSCPTSCAASSADVLAATPVGQRTAIAVAACGGDDPFGGPLAPLRDASDALDYLVLRGLWDSAPMPSAAPVLAVGLALQGPRAPHASTQLVVSGQGLDKDAIRDLGDALRACPVPAFDHRVVLGPGGPWVAGEPCGAALLAGVAPPSDTYAVVDVSWTP